MFAVVEVSSLTSLTSLRLPCGEEAQAQVERLQLSVYVIGVGRRGGGGGGRRSSWSSCH